MNEAETRAEHIDPALAAAGWGIVEGSRIRREYPITLGRIEGRGQRGKALTADYVLEFRNAKLATLEAKAWDKALSEGVAQTKHYAGKLAIRFAYASNGQGLYAIDMDTGVEGEVATYPTPLELWNRTFAVPNAWRDRFATVPFEDRGGFFQGRYYQDIAVERVLAAIAEGRKRLLLTLATGTGKTFIASRSPGSSSTRAGTSPTGRRKASRRGARASSFSPTATSSPTRRTTLSRLSPKMRWCVSSPMTSARRAACRPTATSSSPSSRPS
jgi:type I site-specific restriction endonuclease